MTASGDTARLIDVVLDESIGRSTPDVEHERAVAIFDLLQCRLQYVPRLEVRRDHDQRKSPLGFGFHKRNSALRSMAFCISAGVGFVSSANAACPIGLKSKK